MNGAPKKRSILRAATDTFKYNDCQYLRMAQIHIFVRKVRKGGRVTIPEEIRVVEDIQEKDVMYFAVSDRPFEAKPTVLE